MTEEMTEDELIGAILVEMDRVWGDAGLHGEPEEYAWLHAKYRITEEEDVQWQLVIQYAGDDLPHEDRDDPEVMNFLQDEAAVRKFLEHLLLKYRASQAVYPGPEDVRE